MYLRQRIGPRVTSTECPTASKQVRHGTMTWRRWQTHRPCRSACRRSSWRTQADRKEDDIRRRSAATDTPTLCHHITSK